MSASESIPLPAGKSGLSSRPEDRSPKPDHALSLTRRFVLAMMGMALIDVIFTGAYVLISGNLQIVWRAALVNVAILIGLNGIGAMILFAPVRQTIADLVRGNHPKLTQATRRLRLLPLLAVFWAFIVGMIYCAAAFGLDVFITNPDFSPRPSPQTRLAAVIWFSFAYAAHFAIYAYFAAIDCAEVTRQKMFEQFDVHFHPGKAHIGLRLAIVILALTLISSAAILLDLTVFRDIRAEQGLGVEQAVMLDVIATETAAVLCLIFISRTLTRPIGLLTGAVRKIASGNFAVRSPVSSDDEVGKLAFEFNRMAAGLAEKDRMRRAFERYVSQDVVDLALAREQAGDPRAAGELRFATVMFCDISDFTRLSEDLAPAEVIALLNEYFDRVNAPIRDHGGVVLNYVGDALHAVFNVLRDDADHAAHAVRAAIAIQTALKDHRFGGSHKMNTRIGIHSGPVVAGPVGSTDRIDFTIQGDTANLASRLENLNKETRTEILLSQTTYDLARDLCTRDDTRTPIAFRALGPHSIRGRQNDVTLYTIDW